MVFNNDILLAHITNKRIKSVKPPDGYAINRICHAVNIIIVFEKLLGDLAVLYIQYLHACISPVTM